MQTCTLIARTDPNRHVATVEVSGPLNTAEHIDQLRMACSSSPARYGLLVLLSAVTVINDDALDGLREIAATSARRGQTIAFVCSELLLRAELVLADLDTLAPVVETIEQASSIVTVAA